MSFQCHYFYFLWIFLFPPILSAQVNFKEVGEELGIEHRIKERSIGAGVCVHDFNQDGWDDLTLATGQRDYIAFYVNTGSGFEWIEPLINNSENVKQINWVDFDNDGDADLYVVANGGINRLYKNLGDLQMQDITAESGLAMDFHYGYGAVWGDYNRDGWLDLYYASKGIIGMPDLIPSYSRLFENNADGTFKEVTWQKGAADEDKLPFCSAFIDYNNDQWPDIYTAHDKLQRNTLLENLRGKEFLDVSEEANAGLRMNAMCVAPGDVNSDGWTDIYVTNTPIGSKFLLNQPQAYSFQEAAKAFNITFAGANGWGANFFDADNDGDLDLYVCGSGVADTVKGVHFYENMERTHFEIVRECFEKDTASSFTNAIGDFNNDGRLDIVVQNNPPHPFHFWQNQSTTQNHWIKMQLEGVLSNRDGIGTKIECYAGGDYQSRYTYCGTGFLGQNSSKIHIGLGNNALIDSLILTWSSGHIDRFYQIPSQQVLEIKEGTSTDGIIHVSPDVNIKERPVSTSTSSLFAEETQVLLFPNPSSESLQVQSANLIESIQVFDVLGQLIITKKVAHSAINLELDTGSYWVKVQFKGGAVVVKPFVKL